MNLRFVGLIILLLTARSVYAASSETECYVYASAKVLGKGKYFISDWAKIPVGEGWEFKKSNDSGDAWIIPDKTLDKLEESFKSFFFAVPSLNLGSEASLYGRAVIHVCYTAEWTSTVRGWTLGGSDEKELVPGNWASAYLGTLSIAKGSNSKKQTQLSPASSKASEALSPLLTATPHSKTSAQIKAESAKNAREVKAWKAANDVKTKIEAEDTSASRARAAKAGSIQSSKPERKEAAMGISK